MSTRILFGINLGHTSRRVEQERAGKAVNKKSVFKLITTVDNWRAIPL